MKLRRVFIYPNMSALDAQNKVNAMLEEYSNSSDMAINFDLKIENSVVVGEYYETRYTLIIYVFDTSIE